MGRSTQEVDLGFLIGRVVKLIVEVADPEQIVLFGSAARGEWYPDSDIDLLVVKGGMFRRRSVARDIYRSLSGVGHPVDVVVVHVDDVRAFRYAVGSIIEPALREGRVVYEVQHAGQSRRPLCLEVGKDAPVTPQDVHEAGECHGSRLMPAGCSAPRDRPNATDRRL